MNRAIALSLALLGALLAGAPALAHPSYGIVADGRGNVYFSDLERVWKLAPDGSVTLFRPANGTHVHELALAANGDIIGDEGHYDPATGTFSSGIWSRSPAGVERYLLAPTATPPRGRGLLLDAAGNSYTTQWPGIEDRRTMLIRRSPDGRVTLLMGDPRAAASFRQALVSSIGGIAFDPAGALVFADTRALRRADRSGAVTTLYEGEPMTSLRGVAVAPDGSIYAADIGQRRLLGVTPGGQSTSVYRSDIDRIDKPAKREDAKKLRAMMEQASGEPAAMWGPSIIGFGCCHYVYASGHEGDMPLIGFSPRDRAISLYLTCDASEHEEALARLGKHQVGKGCIYVKRLSDIDEGVLAEMIGTSLAETKAKYPV
ncbi:MAG: DUF1801 domain-containing protein [Sphingosinicella sp.]